MTHSQSSKAKHPLAHVLILNKDPTHGLKEKTPISPSAPNVRVFAKGGAVKSFEGSKKDMAQDMAMDKSMLARHNRLMHPGQKSKLNKGGMVKKMEGGAVKNMMAGGAAFVTKKDKKVIAQREADYVSKADQMRKESSSLKGRFDSFMDEVGGKSVNAKNAIRRAAPKVLASAAKGAVGLARGKSGKVGLALAAAGFLAGAGKGVYDSYKDSGNDEDSEEISDSKVKNISSEDMGSFRKPTISMLDETEDAPKKSSSKTSAPKNAAPSDFGKAFKAARENMVNNKGPKTFDFNGTTYSTRLAKENKKDFDAKKDEPLSDEYFVKRQQRLHPEDAPASGYKPSGYKKGGAAKGGKKVLGTKAEAMKLAMLGSALKAKADAATSAIPMRRPMSMAAPPAGLGAAPPSMPMRRPMAAPMAPGMPMKRGGKAMKKKC